MASYNPGFLQELRRRHVLRAAVIYVAAVWALAQGVSQLSPAFGLATSVTLWFVVASAVGFPFWIAFAWYFRFTPHGIEREDGMADAATIRSVGRKLDHWIIGILAVAVVLLLTNELVLQRGKTLHEFAFAAAPGVSAKSIAVLPFENLSSDRQNDYFVAGMQELVLTRLAGISDLKVIARTSTMKYGSRPQNLVQVGKELGVATLLEGSVQKVGNEVLINVQLIDARTDAHIWAQSYQRTLTSVFGVEGEVAGRVADTLKAKLSPAQTLQLAAAPTTNQQAYIAFLRAEYRNNKGVINYDTGSVQAAIPLYQQAIRLDPGFALAVARLSYAESHLAWMGGGGEDVERLKQRARTDAERALQLQPELAAAQVAIGYSDYWGRDDYAGALKAFAAALALQPNDADALLGQGFVQRRQGRFADATTSLRQALAVDPRNSSLAYELGATYMMSSRYPEAERALQRALAIDPTNLVARIASADAIMAGTGDIPRALAAVQGDDPSLQLERVQFLALQRKYREALALLARIPDTPDNFSPPFVGTKAGQRARLCRLMGDQAQARALYARTLPVLRAQLQGLQGPLLAYQWTNIAQAEIGTGHTAAGLDAVARSLKIVGEAKNRVYGLSSVGAAAAAYAQARRPDLAVPLLARLLASPGAGFFYAPVLLRIDPAWDPIRNDPEFKALLKQYPNGAPVAIPDPSAS